MSLMGLIYLLKETKAIQNRTKLRDHGFTGTAGVDVKVAQN